MLCFKYLLNKCVMVKATLQKLSLNKFYFGEFTVYFVVSILTLTIYIKHINFTTLLSQHSLCFTVWSVLMTATSLTLMNFTFTLPSLMMLLLLGTLGGKTLFMRRIPNHQQASIDRSGVWCLLFIGLCDSKRSWGRNCSIG